jgi:hypothetical protein
VAVLEYKCEELYGENSDYSVFAEGCLTWLREDMCIEAGGKVANWFYQYHHEGWTCVMPVDLERSKNETP